MNNKIVFRLSELFTIFSSSSLKTKFELLYWKYVFIKKKKFSNSHFFEFFTSHFNLSPEFYNNKSILDIGCGPCGSLEWASNAKLKIGLDPLAKDYLKLGTSQHSMNYVHACSETIPFEDAAFDVVSSFNSLDHVDDVSMTIKEIHRVLKDDGIFLLITDVGHKATPFEPQEFSWDLTNKLNELFMIEDEHHYERSNPRKIYESVRKAILYNHKDNSKRYGVLTIRMKKNRLK